jgi:hypothetical protein
MKQAVSAALPNHRPTAEPSLNEIAREALQPHSLLASKLAPTETQAAARKL